MDIEEIKARKSVKELLEFGIINVDKPSGPTSFKTAEIVKKILNLRKMSHFGTLDPKVTGVLPIALNRACKLTGWFMKKDKTYVGIMRIHSDINEKKLKEEMKKFVGKIKQLPPVKSRVKRAERERQVYSWNVLEKRGKEVLFETRVEAGTYIRKLIHDLGLKIGGAHMTELRRTKAGIFDESDSITLYDLEKIAKDEKKLKEIIIPAEIISEILPVVEIKEDNLKQILTGKPIHKQDLKRKIEIEVGVEVAIFCGERFVEVAEIVNQGDIIAKPQFVLN